MNKLCSINTPNSCRLTPYEVVIDNQVIFKNDTADFQSFSKKIYQELACSYPKFFKMDELAKLAFLGAEILLKSVAPELKKDCALVLMNQSASLATDYKYIASIKSAEDYYPRPAVFVYTLPNICAGEISIRHELYTESIFLINDYYDKKLVENYAEILLKSQKANLVLMGWVEFSIENFELDFELIRPKK